MPTRVGCLQFGQISLTFETCSGASTSTIPACRARPRLMCFLTMLTPSITTRSLSIRLTRTVPVCPLLRPEVTRTSSPLRIFRIVFSPGSAAALEDFRRQRHDLHELLFAQLAADGSED